MDIFFVAACSVVFVCGALVGRWTGELEAMRRYGLELSLLVQKSVARDKALSDLEALIAKHTRPAPHTPLEGEKS